MHWHKVGTTARAVTEKNKRLKIKPRTLPVLDRKSVFRIGADALEPHQSAARPG